MVDLKVHVLLEQAIDSRVKLQLLLMFHENAHMHVTAKVLADWCCRDIWSVQQALQEMAEDGILVADKSVGGNTSYHYCPEQNYVEPIQELIRSYDDPLQRETIFRSIQDLTEFSSLRHLSARKALWSQATLQIVCP